jgi:zinc protease
MKRNLLTKFSLLAIAGLALSFSAPAQTAATPAAPAAASKPDGATLSTDQILDKYVNAIGGQVAWQKLNSRVSKGTIDIPAMGVSGTVEIHEKAPDSMIAVVNVAGSVFERGFDGTVGWSDDPMNGQRTLSGPELEDSKRQADFYHQLNIRKHYPKLVAAGTEKVGDRDTYVIEATTPSGDVDKLYFDTQSGLLLRAITNIHSAQGPAVVQAELTDYRDVDGIKLPYSVHQTTAQSSYTITFSEIHHNVPLADSQFAKPAAETPAPAAH